MEGLSVVSLVDGFWHFANAGGGGCGAMRCKELQVYY